MNKIFLLLVLSLVGCAASHAPRETYLHKSHSRVIESIDGQGSCEPSETAFNCVQVVEVYDGDSFFIDIPDAHPFFGRRMGVRVDGIDTPEMRSASECERRKGREAKEALEDLLYGAERVDIVNLRKDKYFRILGTVLADGRSVVDELIRRRLGYPYHGEKKPKRNWCK